MSRGQRELFLAFCVLFSFSGLASSFLQWIPTGAMASARMEHTATLLPSGLILAAGGQGRGGVSVASAELYDPATGTWAPTGAMASARKLHTATLLPSGQVLVVGGIHGTGPLASAELYDPATGTWAPTGSLTSARMEHTATLLPSGKILVVGGRSGGRLLASAELYDPVTGQWTSAGGAMGSARQRHTATLLPSGKVLVVGGGSDSGLASAELYDPASRTWTPTGVMLSAREEHTATLLPSGKVLVAGGLNKTTSINILSSSELYDPETGTWAATGAMVSAREEHTATLLPSGKVLVAGGFDAQSLASAEVYDPGAGTWASTDSLISARLDHVATLLPSGKVLVAGGLNKTTNSDILSSSELYDPAVGTWAATGCSSFSRQAHSATLLPSGELLISGGWNDSGGLASTEVYEPVAGTWSSTASMATVRQGHTATLLPSGEVLVTGGNGVNGLLASAELYDSGTKGWGATGSMTFARVGHTATLLPSGKVLSTGGDGVDGLLVSAEVYDPATGTWSPTGSMTSARERHTATLLPSGKVLVSGGVEVDVIHASAEVYDPATGTWSPTGSMTTARKGHTATPLPSGEVLVTGGNGRSGLLASAEVYELATGTWSTTGSMNKAREGHTATLLPSGKVLVTGGRDDVGKSLDTAELYDSTGAQDAWRPTLDALPPLASGMTFTLTGRGLTGLSEGSSGTAQSSPTRVPLLRLIPMEGGAVTTLGSSHFSSTSVTSTVPHVPEGFYILSVTTQGIPGGGLVQVRQAPPEPGVEPGEPGAGAGSRSYYGWGCSAAPAPGAAWTWGGSVLALGLARRRKRGLVTAACMLLVLAGGQAFAKTDIPETRNPFIPMVVKAYESLELEEALFALSMASAWPDNGPRERLWLALMEGVLQFGAGEETHALADFRRALAIDPEAQLPVPASPRLRNHFAKARAALGPPAPKAPPPETSPPPHVPVPLKVPVSVPERPPARPEPPTPEPPAPVPARQPLEWGVGLRGEAEVRGRALVLAPTGELSRGHLGAAATVLLQPSPGLRLEGRYYLLEQPVRPYVALGATSFFPAVGARAAAGIQVRLDPSFTFSVEAAYERFLNPGVTYLPSALLFSLGAGWRFPATHRR